MNTDNRPLRCEGWQVIDTDEEKRVFFPLRLTDEVWSDDHGWCPVSTFSDDFRKGETYRRRIALPGWIGFATRPPTEADANRGRVFVACQVTGWSGAIALSDAVLGFFPYWMPIPAIPKTQEDMDREEAERVYKDSPDRVSLIVGFMAGLKHARAEREARA
jgi:hypothetical protein